MCLTEKVNIISDVLVQEEHSVSELQLVPLDEGSGGTGVHPV